MNTQATERRLHALEYLIEHQSMKLNPVDYQELIANARSNGAGRYAFPS
jgi:hypothetical protein